MQKVDASLLGFSVTASTDRINVGERDFVDGMWTALRHRRRSRPPDRVLKTRRHHRNPFIFRFFLSGVMDFYQNLNTNRSTDGGRNKSFRYFIGS